MLRLVQTFYIEPDKLNPHLDQQRMLLLHAIFPTLVLFGKNHRAMYNTDDASVEAVRERIKNNKDIDWLDDDIQALCKKEYVSDLYHIMHHIIEVVAQDAYSTDTTVDPSEYDILYNALRSHKLALNFMLFNKGAEHASKTYAMINTFMRDLYNDQLIS